MKPAYLRMIRRMKRKCRHPKADRDWAVYILRCGDGSLYTGIAKDIAGRLAKHNAGNGAAYTRTHRPVVLLYHESGFTRSAALVREAAIKRLPRSRKQQLAMPAPSLPTSGTTRAG